MKPDPPPLRAFGADLRAALVSDRRLLIGALAFALASIAVYRVVVAAGFVR
jgi:hypothetical protein